MTDRVRGWRCSAAVMVAAATMVWALSSPPLAAQEFNSEDGPIRVVTRRKRAGAPVGARVSAG
jgi:hypothetical protein